MQTENETNASGPGPDQVYQQNRIEDQLKYYSDKSKTNKRWYHVSRMVVIVSGALIPLCVGYSESLPNLKYITGLLGIAVAMTEGLISLKKWKDNWFTYRLTAERLRREQFMYQNLAGIYRTDADPLKTFVERAEQIMDSENATWVNYRGQDNGSAEKDNSAVSD